MRCAQISQTGLLVAGAAVLPQPARQSSGAPFAKSPMAKSSSLENPALLPFDFEKPEGWIDGETSSVVVTHWTKNIDGKTVEISILNMNPSDEAWKMNLQAWGNQIGLKEKPDIENLTENIEVSETSAKRIRLDAEGNDQEPGRTVVAVMFAAKEAGWLIKFFGESSLVDESMLEFEKFLESIAIH